MRRHVDGNGVAVFKRDLGKVGLVARTRRSRLKAFQIVFEGGKDQFGILHLSAEHDHVQHVARPSQPENARRTCLTDRGKSLTLVTI